ncbi:GNAT family N-acetyltransferase [Defluviitalea phaphyphila]|uniref:GNAT family N-acetyltransferase n=1 Tax=Defluviitalea phaphyphila TaxID=1473580 RepID=UPI0007302867|nr:GNAT family N-acetyltransferase [Defluviitalea phaphyphila]
MSSEKYAQCENSYLKYVTSVREGKGFIYYENSEFKGLYDYNLATIDVSFEEEILRKLVETDIYKQRKEGNLHIQYRVDLNKKVPKSIHELLKKEGFEHTEYLWMQTNYANRKTEIPNFVSVQKIDNFSMLEEALNFNYKEDIEFGEEVANQRRKMFERLFSREKILFYQLTLDKKVEGFGTAFLHNNIAKLEDLLIGEKYRNRGLGTILINEMMRLIYEEKGVNDFYLITSNEKKMFYFYSRLGFGKIGLNNNYLWVK